MAVPVVEARASGSQDTNSTSHAITLPAGIVAGELLAVLFSVDGAPTVTGTATWVNSGFISQGSVVGYLFYRYATADANDALTLTTSASEQSTHVSLRLSGAAGIMHRTGVTGSSSNSTMASLAPGRLRDWAWLAFRAGDSTVVATAAPSGYANMQTRQASGTGGASTNTAERGVAASTSESPGAWTSASEQWGTLTIGVAGEVGTIEDFHLLGGAALSTGWNYNTPNWLVPGDVHVVHISVSPGAGFSAPSGWTDHLNETNGSNMRVRVLTYVQQEADAVGKNHAFDFVDGFSWFTSLSISFYRGVDTTDPFAAGPSVNFTSTSSCTTPSLTPPAGLTDGVLLGNFGQRHSNIGSGTLTTPTGMADEYTEFWTASGTGDGHKVRRGAERLTSDSATGTRTATSNTTGEAFGTAVILRPLSTAQTVSPTGIASVEAFGAARVDLSVTATGIASGEAFGTARVDLTVTPTSIGSAEAFGATSVALVVSPSGIASGEVFGTASLALNIHATGIVSGEAFGTPTVDDGTLTIFPSGIASAEAFGTARVDLTIAVTGIASGEAFGSASAVLTVSPTGIASVEAFGTPAVTLVVGPSGISSGEMFGTPTLTFSAVSIFPTGIPSAEAFGSHTVTVVRWRLVAPILDETLTHDGLRIPRRTGLTVFGDDTLLVAKETPSNHELAGKQHVFFGGYEYITEDATLRDLWVSSGFEVQLV